MLLLLSIAPREALAQEKEPIRVLSTGTENDYPSGLTFRLEVEADWPLARIDVYYVRAAGCRECDTADPHLPGSGQVRLDFKPSS